MRNTNEIQTYTKKKRKSQRSDMEFVKNFTPADFQAKNLYCQFHLILTVLVRKNTKNEWKWRNLHRCITISNLRISSVYSGMLKNLLV